MSLARLVTLFDAGELDLVGLRRAALFEPAWTQKVRQGQLAEIRACSKADEARLLQPEAGQPPHGHRRPLTQTLTPNSLRG